MKSIEKHRKRLFKVKINLVCACALSGGNEKGEGGKNRRGGGAQSRVGRHLHAAASIAVITALKPPRRCMCVLVCFFLPPFRKTYVKSGMFAVRGVVCRKFCRYLSPIVDFEAASCLSVHTVYLAKAWQMSRRLQAHTSFYLHAIKMIGLHGARQSRYALKRTAVFKMRYCLFILRAGFYELVYRSIRLRHARKPDTELNSAVRKGHPA